MCATATATRNWKRIFSSLEIFIACAILYGIALKITWRYDVGEHPAVMTVYQTLIIALVPMIWAYLAVTCFLLLVPPFFLRSLRASALKAWIVGAVAVIYLFGILAGWWLR